MSGSWWISRLVRSSFFSIFIHTCLTVGSPFTIIFFFFPHTKINFLLSKGWILSSVTLYKGFRKCLNKGLSYGQKRFLSFHHTNKLLAVPHCELIYCVQYVLHRWQWTKILVCVCMLSRVRLFVTPWTVAHQALPSVGFSRQEYWSGLPFEGARKSSVGIHSHTRHRTRVRCFRMTSGA